MQPTRVKKSELEDTVAAHANPNLVKFSEVLLEKVDKKDFVAGFEAWDPGEGERRVIRSDAADWREALRGVAADLRS